jgi:Zn-dependent protease
LFQFKLGSIPVRVRIAFLFLALVLGARLERPDLVAIWMGVVFVSVLVHELGHALLGRAFGLTPQIELHGMGGTTSWAEPRDVGNGRSILISLAGPLAGLALAGVLVLAERFGFKPTNARVVIALALAVQVNVAWGLFNLAPMLPLDGGNVVRSALNGLLKGGGEKAARVVSIVTGGLFLVWAALTMQLWLGALAAFFTWSNMQGYRQADTRAANAPLAQAIEKAYLSLEKQDGAEAIALLRPLMASQTSDDLRAEALRIFAYALLIEGQWTELMPLLEKNAPLIGKEELSRYSKTARELGRTDEADRIDRISLTAHPSNT